MNLDEKIELLFGNMVEPKAVKLLIRDVLAYVKPEPRNGYEFTAPLENVDFALGISTVIAKEFDAKVQELGLND